MKKLSTLFLLFFTITTISFAQNSYQDVVYLNNGSIIRGVIIEQVPNQTLKIKTEAGNVFVYKISEIKKIAKELINSESLTPSIGYQGTIELGYAVGVDDLGFDRLKLNIINGYRVNPHLALGFGTGVHYYPDFEVALIPFFGDFRAYFIENNISPYIGVKVGYSFDTTNDFEGSGFLLNPTIGNSFVISKSTALNISIGYEMQKMKFIYYRYGYSYFTTSENSSAISIDVGISF